MGNGQQHRHGPNCGHLAIQLGNGQLAFRDDEGGLTVFSAPESTTLDDLCFDPSCGGATGGDGAAAAAGEGSEEANAAECAAGL